MTQTRKSLGWWQWETLLVTMGGYALYYIIRKNFGRTSRWPCRSSGGSASARCSSARS